MFLKKYIILFLLTVTVTAWMFVIPAAVQSRFKSVKAFKISNSSVITTVGCTGTVEAENKSVVSFPYQVKINKPLVSIGDKVVKGQKLFDIDEETTHQTLSTDTQNSSDTSSSSSDNSAQTSGNTSVSSDEALSALKEALSAGLITNDTYKSLKERITSGQIVSSAVSSQTVSAAVNKDDAEIISEIENYAKSPMAGVVTSIKDASEGPINAGETAAEITDLNSLIVKGSLDECNLKNVKAGQKVEITGTGFNGVCLGTVKKLYPVVDKVSSDSGTKSEVGVIVSIDSHNIKLMPGLTVNLTIKTCEKNNIVKIPYTSLQQDDYGNEYVYIFSGGQAVRRTVETGTEDSGGVEILKGIKKGDIVIDKSDGLSNGTYIKIS